MVASMTKLCHVQDVNVRKNQQMLSSFFFSACEVLDPGQQAHAPFCIPFRLMRTGLSPAWWVNMTLPHSK